MIYRDKAGTSKRLCPKGSPGPAQGAGGFQQSRQNAASGGADQRNLAPCQDSSQHQECDKSELLDSRPWPDVKTKQVGLVQVCQEVVELEILD